ncbi:MAG: hypothetical protein J6V23_07575 [Bacteroidaceae bacterium]|nr:hypothetical protein [Bacteroidaceae bacterium]
MNIPNLKTRLSTRFKCNIPSPRLTCKRLVVSSEVDEGTSVVTPSMKFKTINRSDEMKPYKCSDFSLHNLIAIGAPLEPQKMQSSQLTTADNLVHALGNLPESAFNPDNNNNE